MTASVGQAELLELGYGVAPARPDAEDIPNDVDARLALPVETVSARRGQRLRFSIASLERDREADPHLLELLVRANIARDQLTTGEQSIALAAGSNAKDHLGRLARLAYLSPEIVTAIVERNQPNTIGSCKLLRVSDLPILWAHQAIALAG